MRNFIEQVKKDLGAWLFIVTIFIYFLYALINFLE